MKNMMNWHAKRAMALRHMLFVALIFFFIMSCGSAHAPLLKKSPDCSASVQGFFHVTNNWRGKEPALVLKSRTRRVLYGRIISRDSTGVYFDSCASGLEYDPPDGFFPYQDIAALIDEHGRVAYGTLDERYAGLSKLQLELCNISQWNADPLLIDLVANRRFEFCLPPGRYLVNKIIFHYRNHDQDRGIDFEHLFFDVQEHTANYLGDWYLDDCRAQSENIIFIPSKIHSRPNEEFMMGLLFGVIGGLIYHAICTKDGATSVHILDIRDDPGFQTIGSLPKKNSFLKFAEY